MVSTSLSVFQLRIRSRLFNTPHMDSLTATPHGQRLAGVSKFHAAIKCFVARKQTIVGMVVGEHLSEPATRSKCIRPDRVHGDVFQSEPT